MMMNYLKMLENIKKYLFIFIFYSKKNMKMY